MALTLVKFKNGSFFTKKFGRYLEYNPRPLPTLPSSWPRSIFLSGRAAPSFGSSKASFDRLTSTKSFTYNSMRGERKKSLEKSRFDFLSLQKAFANHWIGRLLICRYHLRGQRLHDFMKLQMVEPQAVGLSDQWSNFQMSKKSQFGLLRSESTYLPFVFWTHDLPAHLVKVFLSL